MQQSTNKRQSDSQFICKLQDMMEKYPKILNWSVNGKQLVVIDINAMQKDVLPSYFRHSNFGSFVRQLNMYNFSKVCRQKSTINFKNQLFFRGNQTNFFKIKRKKRNKQQQTSHTQFQQDYKSILTKIQQDNRLTSSVKSLLKTLIEFKFVAVQNQKKIKKHLDSICKQLKDCRTKKVNAIVSDIKQNSLEHLQQNLNVSKSIDDYMDIHFSRDLRPQRPGSSTSIPLLEENKTINQIMVQAKNLNFHSSKRDCIDQNYDHQQQQAQISFQAGLSNQQHQK